MLRLLPVCCLVLLGVQAPLFAHPVPSQNHDRTVAIRVAADAITIDYALEVDQGTLFTDVVAGSTKSELPELDGPQAFFDAFLRLSAPRIADGLEVRLDGERLVLACIGKSHEMLKDSVRCDFHFETRHPLKPGQRVAFTFRDGTFADDRGWIDVTLAGDGSVRLLDKTEPETSLKDRQKQERGSAGDALRNASAQLELTGDAATAVAVSPSSGGSSSWSLAALLDSREGFWVLMALAACFGAAHALTPGHGKTLVAAYLVGERGTIWHALFLGIVTTLTHTGAVLVLAGALPFILPHNREGEVASALGLFGGLLVAGLGLWLLLRRLSGRSDHFHVGGHGHHHHHHDPGHTHSHDTGLHSHDEHGHVPRLPPADRSVSWWGLLVLGISGGIVPCWDAILMLGMSARRLSLALPLLLSFSAGLAGVLIVIGMVVVTMKGFATSRWGESGAFGRLIRVLPLVSAVTVTVIGLWLCYDSLHGKTPSDAPSVHAEP